MSSDWPIVELKSIALFQEGYVNPKQSNEDYFGGDIKWLRAVDLNDSFVYETTRKLTQKGFDSAGKSKLLFKPDTLAISKSGTIGRLGILQDYMCGNRAVINITLEPKRADLYYIFYVLFTRTREIEQLATGSVQKNLYTSALGSLELKLPPIDVQREISKKLFDFDEKIRLNNNINETLEAMAQVIFKSWFVDFDPVRAKIEAKSAGRDPNRAAMAAIAGISLDMDWDEINSALDQKLAGMTEEQRQWLARTAELFPDELVESEIGEVPKGWEVKPFYDTIEIIGGGTPKTKIDEYWDGDILWYSVVDAPSESDVFVIDTEKKITKTGLENSSAKLVDKGTTIISARGTVGKLALTPKPMTYNQSCYGLRSKNDCPYFNFYKTKQLVESLKRGSHGSVFDTITQKTFKTIDIVQPPENIEKRFEKAVDGLMSKIQKNLEENRTLTQLRDTLLPKLISGEVSI